MASYGPNTHQYTGALAMRSIPTEVMQCRKGCSSRGVLGARQGVAGGGEFKPAGTWQATHETLISPFCCRTSHA
eukprot:scaffold109514_cov31-Tisochrysis_lutea.AAC.6